jgi:hypothetical protein
MSISRFCSPGLVKPGTNGSHARGVKRRDFSGGEGGGGAYH